MSITLFCLVKGNKSANTFSVKISRDEPISELKEAIKTKKPQTFANVDANDIKLWKVPISDDHDDQLQNLSLEDSDELLAINDIGDYWPTLPPKKHIHVLVSPPETTAISDETFPKVCQLYGLSDDPNPSIDVYPIFKCGCVDTKNEKYGEALRKLFDELETRVATTPIDVSYEATKSIYSYFFLALATFPFKSQIKIVPEKLVEGKNGRRNLDFGIESRTTGRAVGLIEVKKDDFKQGLAQATVQMESSLGHKRKANEIDDEYGLDKVQKACGKGPWSYFMVARRSAETGESFGRVEEIKRQNARARPPGNLHYDIREINNMCIIYFGGTINKLGKWMPLMSEAKNKLRADPCRSLELIG
ncbi:crinkler family protein [Gigaspora margarita]|uniref:Crinkler family protein n=1 Tax=Gigaspora margarita TaxID=4874 RepID=A0A8H3X1Q4_GIGMA|nr:crinkler family protein [Gigaspora margarita]